MKAKNLVVVMSDEHNSKFLGCAGHPIVQTPNFDRLAADGLRYTDASTPSPICVPARAAFATGRYVHQIRHWDNAMPYTGQHRGWGHELQDAGIRVESIGKLHYRRDEDPAGFDVEHIPMHVAGGHGMVWASIHDPYLTIEERGGGRMLGKAIGGGESPYTQYDRSVVEHTVQWLADAAARNEPFVLYVGLVAPHFPLVCPEEFYRLYPHDQLPEPKLTLASGYRRHPWVEEQNAMMDNESAFASADERLAAIAAYHGLVSWLDHNVGQIREALQHSGLADTTNLIYTSDHGDNVGARGLWGKSNMYQESVAVPLIMCGPDIPPGKTCDTPIDLLDLYPTILQAAGLPHAVDERPGRSLFAPAAGAELAERNLFSEYHAAGSNTACFMLRRQHWKLIYYVRHQPELFNLADDPEELNDLAQSADHRAILDELIAELKQICDPQATDLAAKRDQQALIEHHGGRERARTLGAPAATPPPQT
jgi:choline-sulfatase